MVMVGGCGKCKWRDRVARGHQTRAEKQKKATCNLILVFRLYHYLAGSEDLSPSVDAVC